MLIELRLRELKWHFIGLRNRILGHLVIIDKHVLFVISFDCVVQTTSLLVTCASYNA